MSNSELPDKCPNCNADLRDHEHEGYFRTIGIYSLGRDRVTRWRCPDCGHEWERQ